eukprot:GILJ01009485.1.p1 GENE.GILJ01009485.1~~GILJ01009485.1.p1  ORF type:complete len:562 (-),score=74.31 GILJ01009485.1:91-1776(-)
MDIIDKSSSRNRAPRVDARKLPAAFGPSKVDRRPMPDLQLEIGSSSNAEYQQTNQLLSPIKIATPRRERMQKHLLFGNQEPDVNPSRHGKLKPLRRQSEPDTVNDVDSPPLPTSGEASRNASVEDSLPGVLSSSKISWDELIALFVARRPRGGGVVKKMLHVPSLTLISLKELPVWNKSMRTALKQWVSSWYTCQSGCEQLLKIVGTFWSKPQGCVSLAFEHMDLGSLEDLMAAVGALPETVLQEIALQLLQALDYLHSTRGTSHKAVCPSQVLVNRQGRVKLSLGIHSRLVSLKEQQQQANSSFSASSSFGSTCSTYSNPPTFFSYSPSLVEPPEAPSRSLLSAATDVFDLAVLLVACATGDASPSFDQVEAASLRMQQLSTENTSTSSSSASSSSSPASTSTSAFPLPPFLLSKRFSDNFRNFLCLCLSSDPSSRPSARDLLSHPFFTTSNRRAAGPVVSLQELGKLLLGQKRIDTADADLYGGEVTAVKQLSRLCMSMSAALSGIDVPSPRNRDKRGRVNMSALDLEQTSCVQFIADKLGLPVDHVSTQLSQEVYGSQ